MRLLAKSNTARRKRPSLKSADWSGFDDGGLPASVARRADNGLPMGGHIDKSYDSSGSDNRRGSTNSRDPPRPAARAFAVLRSMTKSNLVACLTGRLAGREPAPPSG